MIDVKKVKTRLLSLAFRGALIDFPNRNRQNRSLEIIHMKQKKYIPVEKEEYLIDAPESWSWSRIDYVTYNHGQTTPDETFSYIDVGTLDNVHHRLAEKENIIVPEKAPSRARKKVEFGDVLYSTVRPYLHNICIVDKVFSRAPIASTAFCVMHANKDVLLNKYLFYWLLTVEFDKYSNGDPSKGALYPAIGEKDLLRGVIPLPSVEEQLMIVKRIEQIFSLLDNIDELQLKYSNNLSALKSKLIDAAIQGKLTEQLPEDGTANNLIVLKPKNKKMTAIDIPFSIPNNWRWTSIEDITITVGQKSNQIFANDVKQSGKYPAISQGEQFIEGYTDEEKAIEDIPIIIFGDHTKRVKYVDFPFVICADGIKCLKVLAPNNSKYVFYWMMHAARSIEDRGYARHYSLIKKYPIPIPPVAEQHRIVTKLDEILETIEA